MALSIIIIGAGASGLVAARGLGTAGYAVTVLEAGSEPGGRILTIGDGFSSYVEGGAEFIHGELPLSLQLAKEAGIVLHPIRGNMVRLQKGKSLGSAGGDEFMGKDWDQLMVKMEQLQEDMPIAVFMDKWFSGDQYSALRDSVRRFAEGYDLADVHKVSTKALYNEWAREGEDEEYRLEGGYRRLIDFLVAECQGRGCRFHFSTPVTGVSWQQGRVEVSTATGPVFVANQLVVTASLGVLQADPAILNFSPAIPAQMAAIRQLGYGSVIKILIEFKLSFWKGHKKDRQTLFIISDEPVPTWWTQSDDNARLLTGWLAGGNMRTFQQLGPDARIDVCLRSLATIFGLDSEYLRQQLSVIRIWDWSLAPAVRGGYSYDTVDASAARSLLSQPVDRTIWFAGEALYEGIAPGTVEAAFTSGGEVANKIIAQS
jgi:monoamine oxidase